MDATRDPDSMAEQERRGEVERILARGLVRAVRLARARTSPPGGEPAESSPTCLELSADPGLSVAPRPAG